MARCVICFEYYEPGRQFTCSDKCHDLLVSRIVERFGEFKKVVRQRTGVAYKVPSRDILEWGVREQDLDRYPLWEQ